MRAELHTEKGAMKAESAWQQARSCPRLPSSVPENSPLSPLFPFLRPEAPPHKEQRAGKRHRTLAERARRPRGARWRGWWGVERKASGAHTRRVWWTEQQRRQQQHRQDARVRAGEGEGEDSEQQQHRQKRGREKSTSAALTGHWSLPWCSRCAPRTRML